ncbi:MAG TPA: hypothetical protein VF285_14330 [Castellaniella sp.]
MAAAAVKTGRPQNIAGGPPCITLIRAPLLRVHAFAVIQGGLV